MQLLQAFQIPLSTDIKTGSFTVPVGRFARVTPLDDASFTVDATELQPDIEDVNTKAAISATTTIYTNSTSL